MDKRWIRLGGWALVWIVGCAFWWWSGDPTATASTYQWTVPPVAPQLMNPGFECSVGYTPGLNPDGDEILVPNGWTVIFLNGEPDVSSTRLFYTGNCDPNSPRFIERLGGIDSFLVRSEDIETPPEPGKPFDIVIYQRQPATYGGAYSLSAWMTSKCGNSNPVDCPSGNTIVKAIGIDPNGGIDPSSPAIEWIENRENLRWQNLRTSVTALTPMITVFARMTSSFQFHGNLGFMDEFSLVRAPLSAMDALPNKVEEIGEVVLTWFGQPSQDVKEIPAGNYDLIFDVEARLIPRGTWEPILEGTTQQSTTFVAPCLDESYEFRVRAREEQPEDEEGAFPNQRYQGVWSKTQTVLFTAPVPVTTTVPITDTFMLSPSIYLPLTVNAEGTARAC